MSTVVWLLIVWTVVNLAMGAWNLIAWIHADRTLDDAAEKLSRSAENLREVIGIRESLMREEK